MGADLSSEPHRADAILTLEANGIVVSVNGAAGILFGYSVPAMPGMPFRQLLAIGCNDSGLLILERLSRRLKAAEAISGRYADGACFSLSIAVTMVEVTDEKFFVCILQDLTEQHLAQEKIYHLAHHDSLPGHFKYS